MRPDSTLDRTLARARELSERNEWAAAAALAAEVADADLVTEPELGYVVAYARRRVGQTNPALELTRELRSPCERRGHDRLWRRRLNLEGMLLWDLGDMDGAESAWEGVVESAAATRDDSTLAIAHNNLGIVSTLQGRHDEALTHYERALLAYSRLGEQRGVAETHTNLGIAYREKGFRREADGHFAEAVQRASEIDSEDVRGRAETERAFLLLEAGDAPLAEATARRALQRFEALGDVSGVGDARRVLGMIALAGDRLEQAQEELDQALRCAQATEAALLRAETLEALAVLARVRGDAEKARRLREQSVALFEQMRAYQWGEHVRERLARLAGLSDGQSGDLLPELPA